MLWVCNRALDSLTGANEPRWRKRATQALEKHTNSFLLKSLYEQ